MHIEIAGVYNVRVDSQVTRIISNNLHLISTQCFIACCRSRLEVDGVDEEIVEPISTHCTEHGANGVVS